MPKPVPAKEANDTEFWDFVDQKKLMLQYCTTCSRWQYPPAANCAQCGSKDNIQWKETSGRGRIQGYCVQYDTRVVVLKADQPLNTAVIELEEEPLIKFFSHLPGTPPDEVPVGAPVRLIFQEVAPGRYVHEWEVVK